MKKLSKILSVGLSLVMCASLVMPSFAASFKDLQDVIDAELPAPAVEPVEPETPGEGAGNEPATEPEAPAEGETPAEPVQETANGSLILGTENHYGFVWNDTNKTFDIEAWDDTRTETVKDDEGKETETKVVTRNVKLNGEVKYESGNPKTITIKDGTEVTLDLNGNNINGNKQSDSVITIKQGGTLTLDDNTAYEKNEDGSIKVDEEGNKVRKTDEDGNAVAGEGAITGGTGTREVVQKNGGGIYNEGTVIMNGGTISRNSGDHNAFGGGVYNKGTFTMTGGAINNNFNHAGGGVYNAKNSTFTMEDGTISGNRASSYGGGIYSEGTAIINGGTISGNKASSYGGGIDTYSGTFTMTGGTIEDNTADEYGGGVYNYGGTFNMSGVTISGNTTKKDGGGVYNRGTFNMKDCVIEGNTAKEYGGGVWNNGMFTMEGGTISGNTAKKDGGGVYNRCTFNMKSGAIKGNTASSGGGVYNGNGSQSSFTMESGTIKDNTASDGGGVYISGYWWNTLFTMKGGTITGNKATTSGGGVYISSGGGATFTMEGGTLAGNTATSEGDGIYAYEKAKLNLPANLLWDQDNASDRKNGVKNVYGATVLKSIINNIGLKYHEHKPTTSKTTKEPTCTEAGKVVYTGCYCKQTVTETIDPLGHTPGDLVVENRVEPQVGAAGSYDEVVYCAVCDEELSRETKAIAALPATNPGGNTPTNQTNPTDPADPTNPTDPTAEIDEPDVPLAETPEAPDEAVGIDEPEVPLAELPEIIDIDDPAVPLGNVPQTGEASTAMWLAVLLACGMGLVYVNTGKRKENA